MCGPSCSLGKGQLGNPLNFTHDVGELLTGGRAQGLAQGVLTDGGGQK